MNKDTMIAGFIVLACLGLVITALFLPKKSNKLPTEQTFQGNMSIIQSCNMFIITDHKNNVVYNIVIIPDTKEIKTTTMELTK